jgi:hypothetical protein
MPCHSKPYPARPLPEGRLIRWRPDRRPLCSDQQQKQLTNYELGLSETKTKFARRLRQRPCRFERAAPAPRLSRCWLRRLIEQRHKIGLAPDRGLERDTRARQQIVGAAIQHRLVPGAAHPAASTTASLSPSLPLTSSQTTRAALSSRRMLSATRTRPRSANLPRAASPPAGHRARL